MTRTLLFLLPLAGLLACGDKADTGGSEYESILALDGDVTSGENVYLSTCSGCHASDGTGGAGPDLTEHASHHSDEEILEIVFNGKGSMPGFTLSDQEAADLLAYFRATFG